MMNSRGCPLDCVSPTIVALVYSRYLRGQSVEVIQMAMAVEHLMILDEDAINDIIDQKNEIML